MPTRISNAAARAMAGAIAGLLNGGTINIYTGSQPAEVDAAATGTLLATLTLGNPAFGTATDANPGGRVTANAITDDLLADATGTAGWFRAFNSSGQAVIDGNITVTGGGGDMTLASTSITVNGRVSVTSWTITQPEG